MLFLSHAFYFEMTTVFKSAAVSPSPPESLFTCDVLNNNVEHLNVGASQPSTWRRCLRSLSTSFQTRIRTIGFSYEKVSRYSKPVIKGWQHSQANRQKLGSNKRMKKQHPQRGFYQMSIIDCRVCYQGKKETVLTVERITTDTTVCDAAFRWRGVRCGIVSVRTHQQRDLQ